MDMKTKKTAQAVILSLGVCLAPASVSLAADIDKIVAVVGDEVILSSEVRQANLRSQVASDSKSQTGNALEDLILQSLQLQAAERFGIKIDDPTIDKAVARVANRNGMQTAEFKQALASQGLNFGNFRKNIANQITITALQQRQAQRLGQISEQDVEDLIASESVQLAKGKSFHLQSLTIPVAGGVNVANFDTARSAAETLRKTALATPNFISLKGGNSKASDLGWKSADQLSFAWLKEITLLVPGQISDVVHDANGFHVLKLVKERGGQKTEATEVRARHILISRNTPNGRQKAEKLRKQLSDGADFAVLAKVHSADKTSAQNGGDLAWTNSKTYVPEFAKATETLPLNTLSQLVQTKFGHHIIMVMERRKIDVGREELKTRARKALREKKQRKNYENWLQDLRKKAFVDVRQ